MRTLLPALVVACACASPRVPPRPIESTFDPQRLIAEAVGLPPSPVSLGSARVPEGSKGDLRELYRRVAPATVIVRAGSGYGSGVIVDARGYVLTNHHVIARAAIVDLKQQVQVQWGRLGADGSMRLEPQLLEGWVLDSDPLRDLAIIQLVSPPPGLPSIKVSKRSPVPGQPVAALGHGGIGLLWAIKDGEVAGVGRLATHLAGLIGRTCDEGAGPCGVEATSVERERQRLEAAMPGLVIQSSCPISPGDSGGPLVDLSGELVGVNAFLKTDTRAGVATNFHVHLDEIRAFLSAVPASPRVKAPNPWELIAANGQWLDTDGDGLRDLFVSLRAERRGFVINASQRPITGAWFTTLRPDAVIAHTGEQWLGWFDSDGDGAFERLITSGRDVSKAWALRGSAVTFAGAARLTDPSLLASPRWAALAGELEALMRSGASGPIDPGFGLAQTVGHDLDGDGRLDVVTARRLTGTALFVDATQDVLDGKAGLPEQVRAKPVALRLVRQLDGWWIFLGDSRVLESRDLVSVSRAWLRSASGALVEWPAAIGRDWRGLVVGAFAGLSRERVVQALSRFTVGVGSARPFPVFSSVESAVQVLPGPGDPTAIVTATEGEPVATTLAFAPARPGTREERIAWARQGFPGAPFLWTAWEGTEWFQYDRDGDGSIDLVVLRREGRSTARELTKGEWVEVAPPALPVHPGYLTAPERARFRSLALEVFPEALVAP